MEYTFKTIVENKPGVLYRIVNIFYKRKINIRYIEAIETKDKNISQVTIRVDITKELVSTIAKQMHKIIELISVNTFPNK